MTSRDSIYSQLTQLAIGDFADIVEGTKVKEVTVLAYITSNLKI